MAKNTTPTGFDVAPDATGDTTADANQDVSGTPSGRNRDIAPDAPDAPDTLPTITAPVSFAEAARALKIHPDTLRKRHWPRIVAAVAGTVIEAEITEIVGTTKAGNPITKITPKGFDLLADFQAVAGDLDAITQWQAAIAQLYAIADEPAHLPEPEEEPAGSLAPWDGDEDEVIVIADWQDDLGLNAEADFAAITTAQDATRQSISQAGTDLEQAMQQIAIAQLSQAAATYQRTIAQGMQAIAQGNLQAVMGATTANQKSSAA